MSREPLTRSRRLQFESLEARHLMAASLDGPRGRVNHELLAFAGAPSGVTGATGANYATPDYLVTDAQGRIAVTITAQDVAALAPRLPQYGFQVRNTNAPLHYLEAWATPAALENADALATHGLLGVVPTYRGQTGKGAVGDQADVVLESARVRGTAPGRFDGTGITVGVLSDSYNRLGGAAADIASGDLPSGIKILAEGPANSADEGRAMLQLIHDVAPGAKLAFATAITSQTDFAQHIRDLANPTKGNADIICDDIFFFAEPMFQDGVINQAIQQVVGQGIPYFALAGNLARQAYESTTIGFAQDFIGGTLGFFYDFDPGAGVDTRQRITIADGQTARITLQWDDPFFTTSGVDTDLDFLLMNGNQVVFNSNDNNRANQTPNEFIGFRNDVSQTGTTSFDLVIRGIEGSATPGRIKWVNYGRNNFGPIGINEWDTASPTAVPHAAAIGAIGVGAVPYFNQGVPEPFTSAGPVTRIFNANGTRKSVPEIRQAPHIASIDNTNTTFFGSDISADADTRPNFSGTSAATPHAAAVGALMLQANPNLTPAQMKARLESTAKDIHSAGFDSLTGHGLINAYDAIFGGVTISGLHFLNDFSSGVVSKNWTTDSTANGRIRVINNFPGTTNDHHLVLDTFDNGVANSRNQATLHFNATGKSNVVLTFTQREFSDSDHPMPATFTGNSNTDGVAMSVNGTNWFRIISLTGNASTSTFQRRSFNLSQIAAAQGITLGSNVRIRFQQFGNAPVGSDGFAFDDIHIDGTSPKPPVVTSFGAAVTFTEDGAHIQLTTGVVVTDADSAKLGGGKVTVRLTANAGSNDRLFLRSSGTGTNQIQVSGNVVRFQGTQIGTFTGGNGATPLVVTLNSNSTPKSVQFLLRHVLFRNVGDPPGTAPRTVQVVVTDGKGGSSTPVSKQINVKLFNDAPVLHNLGPALTYNKGAGPAQVFYSASVTDSDSVNFATGKLTFSLGSTANANDRLSIKHVGNAAGQIGVSGVNITFGGTLIGTFTGGSGSNPLVITFNSNAKPAGITALLKAITFRNLLSNPASSSRNLSVTITDGDGGNSGTQIKKINIV